MTPAPKLNTALATRIPSQWQQEMMSLVLRVGLFVLIVFMTMNILPLLLIPIADYYAGAALSVFGAGAIANAIVYRVITSVPP